jgi:uridine phosphorylase
MKNHIKLKNGQCPKRVVVCGDPARASIIAGLLQDSKPLAANREYHSFIGKYNDQEVLVISHGIGSAGAAICFNELIDCGAEIIIRVGTAGALSDEIKQGYLVVATAAIRKDGVSAQMIPSEYPAISDMNLTSNLQNILKNNQVEHSAGIILTSDLFYPSLLPTDLEFYKKAGALAVEMECSTLFIISSLRKIKASAILAIDGHPLKWNEGQYDPESLILKKSLEKAAKYALETLVSFKE